MLKRLTVATVAASLIFFSTTAPAQAAEPYWQCVTFARMFSGIQIFGDAWTWWEQATGKYAKGNVPETGAVLVFKPNGRMTRGHVAVISEVLTDRVVQITHANWGGSRGRVEENVTLVDVSPKGDWSLVRVWHAPSGTLGVTTYPTYGFIYNATRSARGASAGQ
ncbi:MAG: CHAP domain-containing protein [Caulobacteraceae bacterium]|nr:CHAP domain-containing protein [Caulobacteraceae bacterium]